MDSQKRIGSKSADDRGADFLLLRNFTLTGRALLSYMSSLDYWRYISWIYGPFLPSFIQPTPSLAKFFREIVHSLFIDDATGFI